MNPNELENTWNSARNNLPSSRHHQLAEHFTGLMIRRRRFQALWLINTSLLLIVVTALAFHTLASGKVNLDQEWALLPLLILPWTFLFHFLRKFRQTSSPSAIGSVSILDSLRASASSNRAELARLRKIGALFVIMIPILAISMTQLKSAGKVSPGELASMAVLFSAALLLSSAGIAARYFGRLKPQQKQLENLIAELSE